MWLVVSSDWILKIVYLSCVAVRQGRSLGTAIPSVGRKWLLLAGGHGRIVIYLKYNLWLGLLGWVTKFTWFVFVTVIVTNISFAYYFTGVSHFWKCCQMMMLPKNVLLALFCFIPIYIIFIHHNHIQFHIKEISEKISNYYVKLQLSSMYDNAFFHRFQFNMYYLELLNMQDNKDSQCYQGPLNL